MKKRILTILSLVVIVTLLINSGFGFINQQTAYAVGDLNVVWGVPDGDPIFVETNFLPSEVEDRTVIVTNGGTIPRQVGVKGVKTAEIDSLGAELEIVISEGVTDLYGGTGGTKTLQDFFDDSTGINGIPLSTVNSGDSATYNFKVTFPENSGNEYQATSIKFDIKIGIITEIPAECELIDFTGPTIYGTSGSDRIRGTSKSELIIAFEGSDRVRGGGGDDCIVGGNGHDSLSGGKGDDVILGGNGHDYLKGGNGNDSLYGNNGFDFLRGQKGDDFLDGGAGLDAVRGGQGIDTCINAESVRQCEL